MSPNVPVLYSYWRSSCSWRARIGNFYKKINLNILQLLKNILHKDKNRF